MKARKTAHPLSAMNLNGIDINILFKPLFDLISFKSTGIVTRAVATAASCAATVIVFNKGVSYKIQSKSDNKLRF